MIFGRSFLVHSNYSIRRRSGIQSEFLEAALQTKCQKLVEPTTFRETTERKIKEKVRIDGSACRVECSNPVPGGTS